MKKLIYTLISLTILTSLVFPQQKDSLIQLYPGLGDTLDQFDRDYFEIFQNIEGFEYAVFYIRDNKYLVSKVTYFLEGSLRDTTFIQILSALLSSRTRMEQIEKENNKEIESSRECIVATKNGTRFNAKLEMYSKKNLYLASSQNTLSINPTELKFKLPIQKVDSLIFLAESNALSSMGWGALIGLGLGAIGAFAGPSDPNPGIAGGIGKAFGLIAGPILGGLIGLIVGSSSDEEIIEIGSQYDILALKGKTKYYFRYDESIERSYKKIE